MQSLPVAAMLALVISVPSWAGAAEDKALHDAALFHDVGGVQSALKRGADPSATTKTARPISPIAAAAMGSWYRTRDRAAGLAKNDRALKLSQAGLSDRDINNTLALDIVKKPFAAGAKLSRHDTDALFFAIVNGNVELVGLLIDKGASVTADFEGYSTPELAKKYGQEAVYSLLVSRGAVPVDIRSSAQLALVEAAANADVEGMEKAIKEGARVNGIDVKKETALVSSSRSCRCWCEQRRLLRVRTKRSCRSIESQLSKTSAHSKRSREDTKDSSCSSRAPAASPSLAFVLARLSGLAKRARWIHDRDSRYGASFDRRVQGLGIRASAHAVRLAMAGRDRGAQEAHQRRGDWVDQKCTLPSATERREKFGVSLL
jgi:hypothetical protein